MSLIDTIIASGSTVLEKCLEFIHPVSKRIKVCAESSFFFEALVEIIEHYPRAKDDDEYPEEFDILIQELHKRYGLNKQSASNFFTSESEKTVQNLKKIKNNLKNK